MGMFDVVHFPRSIKCVICGKEHSSTQTKSFENLLLHYYVGDIVDETDIISGIIKEEIYCEHKEKKEPKTFKQPIYFVIWHKILIAVVEDIKIAEQQLYKLLLLSDTVIHLIDFFECFLIRNSLRCFRRERTR